MTASARGRRAVVRLIGNVEQEIRAHPRLYDAFYRTITRNARLRDLAGRARDRARGGPAAAAQEVLADPEPVVRRREAALAVRMGLATDPAPRR